MMYESLKRKQLSAMVLQRETNAIQKNPMAVNVGPQTIEDLLTNQAKVLQTEYRRPDNDYAEGALPRLLNSPTRRDLDSNDGFVFQPRNLNAYVSPKVFLENGENFRGQAYRKYNH